MRFSGRAKNYILIVVDFIEGRCYQEFTDMTDQEIKACRKSIADLHKINVVHGDIRPENFLITYPTPNGKVTLL